MAPSNPVRPDFPSHLQVQRLSEELAAAQKTLKEYEDLFTRLYHDACEHCKKKFQRIANGSPVSRPGTGTVVMPLVSIGSPRASSSSTESVCHHMFKAPQISFPWSATGRHAQTTSSSISGPECRSFQDDAFRVFTNQAPACPPDPKVSNSPPEPGQARCLAKSNRTVKTTLEVKLEHVWTHVALITSVESSPDGNHLAVGLVGASVET